MRSLHNGIQTLSDVPARHAPYLCFNETRPETRTMATKHPTQAEINEIVRRAHKLRAEVTIEFFANVRKSLKSAVVRLFARKPNLVRTFLEA